MSSDLTQQPKSYFSSFEVILFFLRLPRSKIEKIGHEVAQAEIVNPHLVIIPLSLYQMFCTEAGSDQDPCPHKFVAMAEYYSTVLSIVADRCLLYCSFVICQGHLLSMFFFLAHLSQIRIFL